MEKTPLKLPKLKTRDELLRTAPELGRLLAAGDAEGTLATAPAGRVPSPLKNRPRSSATRRAASPGRLVRKFTDDELTEEDRVRSELERVKAERSRLLASLARLRADNGKSGGELQQEDIRLLRCELESKQEKLNELRRQTAELNSTLEQLETTSRDCEQLMPQAMADLRARVESLEAELAGVEQDIVEAEAKHELYKLLEIRTGRDHAAAKERMREVRALKEGAADDFTALTKQMHELRAAKEDAERDLGAVVMMYDQLRGDWSKKLKDRRKEVRELERRNFEDEKRRAALAALAAEKARLEQEVAEKTKTDREAAKRRLSTVVPELDVLEATWARLHGVCGAANADQLIAHWKELKAKEASMQELVRLAEVREARAKQEMAELLADRADAYETDSARGERQQQKVRAAAVAATGEAGEDPGAAGDNAADGCAAADGASSDGQEGQAQDSGTAGAEAGTSTGEEGEGANNSGEAPTAPAVGVDDLSAQETQQSSPAESQQEGTSPSEAVEDAENSEEASSANSAEAAPVLAEEAAAPGVASHDAGKTVPVPPLGAVKKTAEQLLMEKQAAIAEARRRRNAAKEQFSKLSQVCVSADQGLHLLCQRLKAAMEPGAGLGMRRITSLHDSRRLTASQSDSRRVSLSSRHTNSMTRRTTGQQPMRVSAAGLIERRTSIATTLLPAGAPAGGADPTPRQAGQQGDKGQESELFPELPSLASDVGTQLFRLMQLVDDMEAAAAAAEAAAASAVPRKLSMLLRRSDMSTGSEQSGLGEESAVPSPPGTAATAETQQSAPASTSRVPSKKLQWADGQATPRMTSPGQPGGAGGAEGQEGPGAEESAEVVAQGEKELRKGFRRRTWAGPAWLNAVSSKKPLTTTLRKMTASRGGRTGGTGAGGRGAGRGAALALKRIAGYVEEPDSDDEGPNPFVLSSSEDEAEEDGVVDRQYLKHRAHKLTNPKIKGKPGQLGGSGSPTVRVDAGRA